jgi:plasmid stability protein
MTAPVAYAPPLTIRNLPLDMYEWLKEQANAQHRSLNKHVAALLADWRQLQMTVPNRIQEDEETQRRLAALKVIMARAATLPILDHRTADEILGYDDAGLPS